jgi:DNA-directed RNA polymerase subunit M/transcription elongation factor TFIIS
LEQILVPEGMHRCSCGCRRVSSTSIQMRRADESATVFLICSQCNKVWRN